MGERETCVYSFVHVHPKECPSSPFIGSARSLQGLRVHGTAFSHPHVKKERPRLAHRHRDGVFTAIQVDRREVSL